MASQCRSIGFASGSGSNPSRLCCTGYDSFIFESNEANPHNSSRGVYCLRVSSNSCSLYSCHCSHCHWVAYSAAQLSLGHPARMVLAITSVRNLLYGRRNDGRILCFFLHDLHLTTLILNKSFVPSSKYPCLNTLPQPCTEPPQ